MPWGTSGPRERPFSGSGELQHQFLETAQTGIVKINQSTSDACVEYPFGGWKASGVGPPEHSIGDIEFYTRIQAVYRPDEARLT